jgi:hypothetical protein
MELLRDSNRLRRLGAINDSIFESTGQLGNTTAGTQNTSVIQEIIDRDVPSSHTNGSNSNATHTMLGSLLRSPTANSTPRGHRTARSNQIIVEQLEMGCKEAIVSHRIIWWVATRIKTVHRYT